MNPLRSLAFDADAITRYATTIKGPIVPGEGNGPSLRT